MKNGFSLVELSIVLVILGLLTGGILTGKSLIRAAELRAVSTEYGRWVTAMHSFRDRYFMLPGDITNATSVWGLIGTGTCPSGTGTGTQTCNGDGDGTIEQPPGPNSNFGETFTFWQHLANAGLIEGSYTGKSGSGTNFHTIVGTNSPPSKLNNAGWTVLTRAAGASSYQFGTVNTFQLGAIASSGSSAGPTLKPEEMWGVDKKLDDGKPAYGIVRPLFYASCTDSTTNTDYDKDYNLDNTAIDCTPVFMGSY